MPKILIYNAYTAGALRWICW